VSARSTEVVIVGAGFAGCATAWALAERGVKAIVLERESELGRHASGRGAGLGRQLTEDDDTTQLTIRGASMLHDRFAASWRQTGGLLTFDDANAAKAYVDRARAFDVPHEIVDRAHVLRHWPAMAGLSIEAALFVPRDGVIETRGLLRAFARDLAIETGVSVTRVTSGNRGALVETSHGTIEARVVVDAAGAWAGAATGDPALMAFKRHLFSLEAAAPQGRPYLWHLGANEVYVRADDEGVLACPCDTEQTAPADQQPSSDADARLAARLAGWTAPVVKRWACQRAFAPDRKMRIGRDAERPWLVWAAALGGHGATASAAIGERAAAAVVEAMG
jgi:glycine/D-amino acid oxidase-like deaminating enzyme